MKLNIEFGCQAKPKSMLNGMNIESGFVAKPKSDFTTTNIDFGCMGGVRCRDMPAGCRNAHYDVVTS